MSIFRSLVASLLLLCLSSVAMAAPQRVKLTYEATRNGQPFATVNETYRQEGSRYRIESVTKGIGVYALFGERRLTSEGEVTAQGLKPEHFELHQGDNEKRSLYTDFDWANNLLKMKVKGKLNSVPLVAGAQDISSFVYQFMFVAPSGSELILPVTTGKKLRTYHYHIDAKDELMEVGAGKFKVMHLSEAVQDEDGKELWLAVEHHHLPVKLRMIDDKGSKIEQVLTHIHIE
ncbi:DUF3108 domain-containing protein [Methylobacillus flagellatus]|uniref:DUF3108 domain-containing protein n=1 Tax=Methylobacillus flagellatus (strain ATCC 51484 / DSM 6875 / VKM B-1610 / KT) TaxID=265072 RepID=Q1H4W0_METFK|nr:DUF3108 domain-containing protein [Methylobacillus flagellatus]ABE48477.1 conserved hypothetical protein [Methylobacillus flagellatus KT]